jgi:hypothetical protein
MSKRCNVSAELEVVEREIDSEYLRNPLTRVQFSQAAWCYLAWCEEKQLKALKFDAIDNRQQMACFVDHLVNTMKIPLRWLWRSCPRANTPRRNYDDDTYQASWDLDVLAEQYQAFETAYTYARAGVVDLKLCGNTLVPTSPFRTDTRYEAYDRLRVGRDPTMAPNVQELFHEVARGVRVAGHRFRYRLNPALVRRGVTALLPAFTEPFAMPDSWRLPRYSLGEFRAVIVVLQVMAMIHYFARVTAARQGCGGLGYDDCVLVLEKSELLNRLRRYTGLDVAVIKDVTRDLTYAECSIHNPDPALQPLIALTPESIAICPGLFMGINAERNFIVLLNRLPNGKDAYSRLSTEREGLLRERVIGQLKHLPLRFWTGRIPGRSDLPDLDLAIVDELTRTVLIQELKAFLQPAEPREVLEKSQEIERGVGQIQKLRDAFQAKPETVTRALSIGDNYKLCYAVASETFVGTPTVQDCSIPVVHALHIVDRLRAGISLPAVCRWLESREYLPAEGVHYEVKEVVGTVGKWKINWYGIKPLIEGEHF